MPRERTFWLILASLILAGFVASLFGQRPHTEQVTLSPEAPPLESQKSIARVWKEAEFKKIAAIPTGQGSRLERPTLLRTDRQRNLYVLDSEHRRIERISPSGELLATYASDFQNPSDVVVAESGEVWVCDPAPQQITVFSPKGRIARVIRLEAMPMRIALDPKGGFLAMLHAEGAQLFRRYSPEGRPLEAFGTFFPEARQNALTADGWFLPIGSGAIAYPFENAGLLASYSLDGRLRFFRETIDPAPLPVIAIDAAGGQRMAAKARRSTLSSSVLGDEIYLLGPQGKKSTRVLDVYGAKDGSYRYSLAPPDRDLRSFALAPGILYGASRHGLTIWHYSPPPLSRTSSASAVSF